MKKEFTERDVLTEIYPVLQRTTINTGYIPEIEDHNYELQFILSKVVESLPNAIIVTDKSNQIVYVNPAAEKLTGYPRGELVGKSPAILGFEENIHTTILAINNCVNDCKNWRGELMGRRKNGSVYSREMDIFPVKSNNATINYAAIVYDKKCHNDNDTMLLEFAGIVWSAHDAIINVNRKGIITVWNHGAERIFGYRAEDAKGNHISFIGLPSLLPKIRKTMKTLDQNGGIQDFQTMARKKDGKLIYISSSIFPIKNSAGETTGYSSITRDITESKQIEKNLRLSEEKFSKVFHCCPFPMVISTIEEGRFIYVNDAFEKSFGYQREKIIGLTSLEIKHWVNREEREELIRILNQEGFVRNFETSLRLNSGETRTGLISAEIVCFGKKRYMLSIFNDITERKRILKEMALLDRLHMVGEMAAGIGHEIRNPMTTISGFLQLLKEKDDIRKYHNYFNIMMEELERANSIITEYLSLARNKSVEYEMVNINTILETLLPLIYADAIKANKYISADLGQVPDLLLNAEEIRQLVLNLVRNGLEAMSAGGNLYMRTFMDDGRVILEVQDQGQGIDPQILDKIGTPFFTTKDSGTGLGLAVCYSIAARHNAKIDISTGQGGTTFSVCFERQKDKPAG